VSWMAWTLPTAIFFAAVAVALAVMTVWELVSPTVPRRGLLPLVTTRGDRFFIALLSAAFVHVAWLAATDAPVVIASIAALLLGLAVMRWG
jgi:predicted small integral membrane protein